MWLTEKLKESDFLAERRIGQNHVCGVQSMPGTGKGRKMERLS
ncbi:hypothetical protein GMMP15_1290001 [Candidatus Magnetomoraceae bacterium gMMP-15]